MEINLNEVIDELFLASLVEGKEARLHVTGTSMLPSLKPGDVVVLKPVEPEQLQKGDLVVVRHKHDLVTHRLIGQQAGQWLTKGDNCRQLDPPAAEMMILGKVISIERSGEKFNLQEPYWQTVNRWLARLGWLEALVFHFGSQLRGSPPNHDMGSGSEKRSLAGRVISLPFRLAIRLLVR